MQLQLMGLNLKIRRDVVNHTKLHIQRMRRSAWYLNFKT